MYITVHWNRSTCANLSKIPSANITTLQKLKQMDCKNKKKLKKNKQKRHCKGVGAPGKLVFWWIVFTCIHCKPTTSCMYVYISHERMFRSCVYNFLREGDSLFATDLYEGCAMIST